MKKSDARIKPFVISVCIGLIITFAYSVYADKTEESIAKNLIRLHVIANSDSDEDQSLKLKVRDAIIEETGSLFANNTDKTNAEKEIIQNADKIETIARNVIADNGYDYKVSVSLGRSEFPTKTYGNVTLPAGTYDALKVVIGDGKGQNWWCVLFPPLCFVNEATAQMPDSSSEILKSSMTDEEYAMITDSGTLPIKVKFKSYELWQSSKLKIKNMVAEN